MSNTVTAPKTVHEAQALLTKIGLPALTTPAMQQISALERDTFKDALVDVATDSDPDGTRKAYLMCVIAAFVPKTKAVIRQLGLNPPHESILLELSKSEGMAFNRAIRSLGQSGADIRNTDEAAYLTRVLTRVCDPAQADSAQVAPHRTAPQADTPRQQMPPAPAQDRRDEQSERNSQASRQNNVHQMQRGESRRAESYNNAAQEDASRQEQRAFESTHIYGGNAALCFGMDTTRSNGKPTVNIDGASACGTRQYDWANKTVFQLTVAELPLVFGVLYGFINSITLSGHGANNEKTFSVENQGPKFFMSLKVSGGANKEGGRVIAVPVLPKDSFQVMSMLLRQIQANNPGIPPDALIALIRRVCTMTQEKPVPRAANQ